MATKTKYNTENLPVTLNNVEHMVKKSQYIKQKANELSIQFKADFKQDSVKDIISLIEQGKALSTDNPEEYHKAYDIIKTDMDRAMEVLAAKSQEEATAKKAEDDAKAAKEKEELALVESVGTLDVAASFANLSEKFNLGSDLNQCTLKEGVEVNDTELMGYFVTAFKMGEFSNWAKGDLMVALEDRGHERAMQEFCATTGTPYQTAYRMAITSRAVPPSQRVKGVSFTAYQEVATSRLDKDETKNTAKRDALIARVGKGIGEDNGAEFKNVKDVRAAVLEAQGREAPAPRDPNAVDKDKDQFIVIDYDERNSYVTTGLKPGSLTSNSLEVIHLKTARRANDEKGNRWGKLEEWKDAAEEAATAAAATATAAGTEAAPKKKKAKKK